MYEDIDELITMMGSELGIEVGVDLQEAIPAMPGDAYADTVEKAITEMMGNFNQDRHPEDYKDEVYSIFNDWQSIKKTAAEAKKSVVHEAGPGSAFLGRIKAANQKLVSYRAAGFKVPAPAPAPAPAPSPAPSPAPATRAAGSGDAGTFWARPLWAGAPINGKQAVVGGVGIVAVLSAGILALTIKNRKK
jgi:hypothetical protein